MSDLKPGPELDAAIAEHVMGWERVTDAAEIARREQVPDNVSPDRWHRKCVWFVGDEPMACDECGSMPEVSTSWDAMRLVVEKLAAEGYNVTMETNGDLARCTIHRLPDGTRTMQEAAHDLWNPVADEIVQALPHAVCLAALQAVGHE